MCVHAIEAIRGAERDLIALLKTLDHVLDGGQIFAVVTQGEPIPLTAC